MGLPEDQYIKHLPRKVERCDNCGHLTYYRDDYERGDTICQKCGYTITKGSGSAISEPLPPTPDQPGHDIEEDHYKWLSQQEKYRRIYGLQKRYEKTSQSKQEYRENSLYKQWVGILHTEYYLTNPQKEWLNTAIERLPMYGGMKEVLCRNCSYEQILTSLAIRLMRKNKRRFSINTNKFCKSISLTSGKYYGIIENLEDLQEKGLINFKNPTKTKVELLEKSEKYRKEIEMIYALREIKRKAPHRKLNS